MSEIQSILFLCVVIRMLLKSFRTICLEFLKYKNDWIGVLSLTIDSMGIGLTLREPTAESDFGQTD